MIWGDIINPVRKLHLDLAREFSIPPSLFAKDIELDPSGIPFPEVVDDFDEWQEIPLPPEMQDLIPLHPVERTLLEGPLLPIQLVRFSSAAAVERLFAAILLLEKEWLRQHRILTPDKIRFLENFSAATALKISIRAGFQKIKPVQEG